MCAASKARKVIRVLTQGLATLCVEAIDSCSRLVRIPVPNRFHLAIVLYEREGDPFSKTPSNKSEVRRRAQHVAIVCPHFAFTRFLRGRQMNGVGGMEIDLRRAPHHNQSRPLQHRLSHRNQSSQTRVRVLKL
jgi:hypothetical protein